MAKQQEPETRELAGLEGSALFGVAAQRARDNDVALHTNQARGGPRMLWLFDVACASSAGWPCTPTRHALGISL